MSVTPEVPELELASEQRASAPPLAPTPRGLAPWAALCLVLALGIGFAATRGGAAEAPPERVVLPVETVAFRPVTSYLTTHAFTGKLNPPQRATLGFERGGRVAAVTVREGQRVAEGAVLARLDSAIPAAQLLEARGRLAAAQARLSELIAGPRRDELASARQRVQELSAQLELARLTRERQERLASREVISPEGNDAARTQEQAARARLAQAKSALALLVEGTRAEQIQAQRATVQALEGTLATLQTSVEQCTLRAPFAGRVGLVEADPGTVLAAGVPALSLVASGPLEAWVGVPPGPALAMTPGSPQLLLIEGVPHRAQVRSALPELDQATRTKTMILSLEDSDGLIPEQIVRLVLPRELPCEGGWVPLAALNQGERAVWSVFVVVAGPEGEVVERRIVEVLQTEPERVLVKGNLRPGEAVIATGVQRVVPGQRVSRLP